MVLAHKGFAEMQRIFSVELITLVKLVSIIGISERVTLSGFDL